MGPAPGIREDAFPRIAAVVIREIHGVLLRTGRGSSKTAGRGFGRTQNWIGGTRPGKRNLRAPASGRKLNECLGRVRALSLHADHPGIPLLVKSGVGARAI